MKDLGLHLFLFFLAGTVIVVVSVMFAHPEDEDALRVLPWRWLRFFGGCAVVVGVLLLLEWTVAAVH